jgi:hypothetical protein
MKTKVNVHELEQSIDFEAVGKKLLDLAESGGFKRRKTVADLLDKVQEALLKAREGGVSFRALTAFLQESGIPVSEPTLRQYLHAQGGSKKPRRKTAAKPAATPKPSGEMKPQPVQSRIDENRAKNTPPAPSPYVRRERGPRIADPGNV